MAKVTVSSTNQTLAGLLSKAATGDLLLKNFDTTITIYIEIGAAADVTSSYPLEPGEVLPIANIDYSKVNVKTSSTSNTNFYVLERLVN